jgi:chemotaxis protein CheD
MQHPGQHPRINIVQGEYHVSGDTALSITTLLGSCVAACISDPVAQVGGMNHFLLPGDEAASPLVARHGVHLMELLINGLLKKGAARDRLEAKLFGGARTMQGLGDIGATNARFAQDFLKREGITITGGSLGGETGRRIQFWPASGRVRQKLVRATEETRHANPVLPTAGELELF